MTRPAAALLLLLACCAAPRTARGEDGSGAPAAAPDGGFAPADLNHDGTVTKREARRYRRRQRRANGSDDSSGGSDGEAGGDAPSISEAAAGAMARAGGAAAALQASLPNASAGDMPKPAGAGTGGGGAPGSGAAAAARAGAAAAATPGAAAPAEMALLAARAAYAPAFAAAGLKLAADGRSVVRLDGSPASAEDWRRLRRQLDAMPKALERRPDFFQVIAPARFEALKEGYHAHPEMAGTVYKHVAPTAEDRDLVHTASCSKVSGDCNAFVEKASYKKGDFVAPEDLKHLWDELEKESGGPEEPKAAADGDSVAPRAAAAPAEAASEGAPAPRRPQATAAAAQPAPARAALAAPARLFAAAARWLTGAAPGPAAGAGEPSGGGSRLPLLALAGAAVAAGAWLARRRGQ